jgi:hypothetical protein
MLSYEAPDLGEIPQGDSMPELACFPVPIMQWSEGFYRPVFSPYGNFKLREHGMRGCKQGISIALYPQYILR